MPRQGFRPEEGIAKLREPGMPLGRGKRVAEVVKALARGERDRLRNEPLEREIFHSLGEARAVIEAW